MKYKVRSESIKPSKIGIDSIENSIAQVLPDIDTLIEWYKFYANEHKERLAFDIDYVREYISAESVIIEFGAIPPILTIALTNLGYQVCALDIAPERFSNTILSSGLDIRKANIETQKLPFESNTFHAALFNEIFEHLRINPIETLGEVIRVLKPGGTLLLSTPNLASLKGYRELIFRNKAPGNVFDEYMKLETLGHMGHVREYTPIEVCTFLEGIGFEIREVIFRGKTVSRSIWKSTIFNTILFFVPCLRRFFSVVATKPASRAK